ncbi:hypothetical protein L596_013241 [Steinernema carpocapsae]|uniref:Uncharacterized protein n=1 Tax=Steinernema carpocapsae TaxID=34508 RepID=A0A4U5NZK4_STECR|nr:hypothetical protein L596_013241 [Steinernema carpocapsae]
MLEVVSTLNSRSTEHRVIKRDLCKSSNSQKTSFSMTQFPYFLVTPPSYTTDLRYFERDLHPNALLALIPLGPCA